MINPFMQPFNTGTPFVQEQGTFGTPMVDPRGQQRRTSERNKKLGFLLYGLGSALRGDKNFVQNTMALQEISDAKEKEEKQNKLWTDWVDKNKETLDPRLQSLVEILPPEKGIELVSKSFGSDRDTFERFGVFKNGQQVGAILKDDMATIAKINEDPSLTLGPVTPTSGISQAKIYQPVDGNNQRVGGPITYSEFVEKQKSGEFKPDFTLVEIAKGEKPPTVKAPTLFNEETKPIAERWQATNTLQTNLQGLANEYAKSDEAALTGVGATANFINSIIQNTQGFIAQASSETNAFYKESQKNKNFVSDTGTDFTDRVKNISEQFGVNESRVRDLAYLFAAARGQEGRGLSDRDYENALNIVSGGVGKSGKIKVIEDVYNRLSAEVSGVLNNKIAVLNSQKKIFPDRATFFDESLGQLQSLTDATPFLPFQNPLLLNESSTNISDEAALLLKKYSTNP